MTTWIRWFDDLDLDDVPLVFVFRKPSHADGRLSRRSVWPVGAVSMITN